MCTPCTQLMLMYKYEDVLFRRLFAHASICRSSCSLRAQLSFNRVHRDEDVRRLVNDRLLQSITAMKHVREEEADILASTSRALDCDSTLELPDS